jgi:drug/metabolite transporter (DMT)-like permease
VVARQAVGVSPAVLALAAAVVLAGSSRTTKLLAVSFPHRQLIGPLLLLNAALVVPLGLFSHWTATTAVVLIQAASVATLLAGSFCMFELFSRGSAAAVAVGQAIAPVPALAFSFVLLSASLTGWQAAGDLVVTAAVLIALGPVFGQLSRRHATALVALAAALNGLLVVLTKMLTDRGLGVAEIYVTRTAVAGLLACVIAPPREIPLRALPRLTFRSALQTLYFVLLILAVQRGNPATVQTLVATTPIMLLALDAAEGRARPPLRLTVAAAGVVVGVALAVA